MGGKILSVINDFNAKEMALSTISWIQNWFEENGKGCKAVIGISGGKDSTVTAALCVEALGKDNVIGVIMPSGYMPDLPIAKAVCEILGIENITVDINDAYLSIINEIEVKIDTSNQAHINLPARLRMATLYAVSQSVNGRVANTCNLSEDWVGYSTRYGDSAGDFAPIAGFLTDEVIAIGQALNIPDYYLFKTPSDGLCGKSDEDNLGFTYATLNKYIRTGIFEDINVKNRIDELHDKNTFKMLPMSAYHPMRDKRYFYYPW